jgi:hypothetical protein
VGTRKDILFSINDHLGGQKSSGFASDFQKSLFEGDSSVSAPAAKKSSDLFSDFNITVFEEISLVQIICSRVAEVTLGAAACNEIVWLSHRFPDSINQRD